MEKSMLNNPNISPIPINWNPINKISFEDAPTDYVLLCKSVDKLNEVINALNNLEPVNVDYVDSLIDAVYTTISNVKNSLESEMGEILTRANLYSDKQVGTLLEEIQTLITQFDEKLKTLKIELQNEIYKSNAELSLEIQKLKQYIDTALEKYSFSCYNPIQSKVTSLCEYVNDIFNKFRYDAITCMEFDSSGITANEFDSLNLTALTFDLYSKEYIHKNMCDCLMINPYTGILSKITDVIYKLVTLVNMGITAQAFDNLDVTVTAFDQKQITAYEFDFNGENSLES